MMLTLMATTLTASTTHVCPRPLKKHENAVDKTCGPVP